MSSIHTKSVRILDETPRTRQELDLDFLGSGYRRKVYVASDPDFHWQGPPRQARTPLTFVCIPISDGTSCRLVYGDPAGEARVLDLEKARYYSIPANVPHQVRGCGVGVLEIYAPADVSTPPFGEDLLPDDFFESVSVSQKRR